MEHDKYAIYIIWLVAIVGVVSLVAVFTGVNSQTVTGQAFGTCSDSDGGENIYKTGTTIGLRNGGYHAFEDYCYDGSEIVEACDSCHLYEFYCDGGFVKQRLYWSSSSSNNLYCENGRMVEETLDDSDEPGGEGELDTEEVNTNHPERSEVNDEPMYWGDDEGELDEDIISNRIVDTRTHFD